LGEAKVLRRRADCQQRGRHVVSPPASAMVARLLDAHTGTRRHQEVELPEHLENRHPCWCGAAVELRHRELRPVYREPRLAFLLALGLDLGRA
jgi:hypothetical protein